MDSKDISTVVLISLTAIFYSALVNHLRVLTSAIPTFRYVFSLGTMILVSLALLVYNGKRGRFLLQGILIAFLTLPISSGGSNFNPITHVALILINTLHGDLLFNAYHDYFKKKKKLRYWAILSTIQFFVMGSFLNIINFYLFFTSIDLQVYLTASLLVIPIIIIESVIGGEIGYRIYLRTKQSRLLNEFN